MKLIHPPNIYKKKILPKKGILLQKIVFSQKLRIKKIKKNGLSDDDYFLFVFDILLDNLELSG